MKRRSLTIQCVFDELRLSLHIILDRPIRGAECQTAERPQELAIKQTRGRGVWEAGAEKASQNKKQEYKVKEYKGESEAKIETWRVKLCTTFLLNSERGFIDAWQRAKERRKEWGNIHSLQRSPKKGILNPADALSAAPERGWKTYSLQEPHNLTIYNTKKIFGNAQLTNSKLGK